MKRFLAILAAAVIVFAALCVPAFAADSPLIIYNIPDYEGNIDYGGVETHFVQAVDWASIYGPNDGGNPLKQVFWGTHKDMIGSNPVLTVPLSVVKAGKYQIFLQMYVAGDFGQFSIALGDTVLSENTDFFGSGDLTYFDFGIHDVPAGNNTLKFTLVGCNTGNTHAENCVLGISRLVLCRPGYTDAGIKMRSIRPEGNDGFFFQDLSRDFKGDWNPHYVIAGDDNQVFTGFKNGNIGGKVTVPVTVPERGKYRVSVRAFKGGDFGIFKFELGGKVLTESSDWFGDGGLTTVDLGTVELSAGNADFVATLVGANPDKDNDGANFALNSIILEKIVPGAPTGDGTAAAVCVFAAAAVTFTAVFSKKKKV